MTETPTHFKLRESVPHGRVILFKNDEFVFQHSDYGVVAEFARDTFHLSDASLMSMYQDYREDYDNR